MDNRLINQEDGTWRLVDDHHKNICEFSIGDYARIKKVCVPHGGYKQIEGEIFSIEYFGYRVIINFDTGISVDNERIDINHIARMEIVNGD